MQRTIRLIDLVFNSLIWSIRDGHEESKPLSSGIQGDRTWSLCVISAGERGRLCTVNRTWPSFAWTAMNVCILLTRCRGSIPVLSSARNASPSLQLCSASTINFRFVTIVTWMAAAALTAPTPGRSWIVTQVVCLRETTPGFCLWYLIHLPSPDRIPPSRCLLFPSVKPQFLIHPSKGWTVDLLVGQVVN